jgi:hypothetical protein
MERARAWWICMALLGVFFVGCPDGDDDDSSVADDDDATGDDDDATADDDDSSGDDDDTVEPCEDTASGSFPAEAVELSHTSDEPMASILGQGWYFEGYGGTYYFEEQLLWEAVRFDLEAPATVYGARVVWSNLVGQGERPVTLGAYEDFGSNGFDFDQWDALWEGDRCLVSDDEGAWVDYVFDQPIEVELPGLFFIAQQFQPTEDPADDPDHPLLMFDTSEYLDCASYENCHSAWNLPEADADYYYNGTSFGCPYNYSVRLMVELHDTIAPEDKWFQIDEALSASSQVSWGDYDDDGWDDLLTNGPTLYRNNGDGTFTDVSAAAGLDALSSSSSSHVWGDFDNDGCLDFFAANSGYTAADMLVRSNCDGTFSDVTEGSGIDDTQSEVDCDGDGLPEHAPTPAAGWLDFDGDGFLDLYMASYECWDAGANYPDAFFRNNGDGTFANWTDIGFTTADQAGRGVSPNDVDMDGDTDIFVSNYRLDRNFMYENVDGESVVDRSLLWGLAGENVSFYYGHTIGSAWIDLENDGDWDLIQSNLAHPRYYEFSDRTMVLVNDGTGYFDDTAADAGIHYRETHSNPTVQDFDGDGDWDLFLTCVYDGRFSEMYLNDGAGNFTQVNYESGAIIHNGWGSAASDYDNDGDVDLVAYDLFRNDSAAAGNHWLQVRAIGDVTANRAALGSRVEVDAGGQTRMNLVSGGSGTGCQDSMYLHFGLGAATTVDEVRIYYPGGAQTTFTGPFDVDQRLWLYESGNMTAGWAP